MDAHKTVESIQAAVFFADSNRVKRLFPFMLAEHSLSEAAKALGVSPSLMGYWIKVMRRLALVEIVRVDKRGRHRVPIYRAVAMSFFVPLELIPVEAGERLRADLLRFIEEPLEAALTRQVAPEPGRWRIHCTVRNAQRWLAVEPNDSDWTAARFVHQVGRVRLTDQRAEAFQRELRELLKRYTAEDSAKGNFYLYRSVIVKDD